MVRAELERQARDIEERSKKRLEDLATVRKHRDEILARRGGVPIEFDIVAEINRMREENDEENITGIAYDRD
jgi:hypothetical protein